MQRKYEGTTKILLWIEGDCSSIVNDPRWKKSRDFGYWESLPERQDQVDLPTREDEKRLSRIGPSRRLVPLSGMAFLSNCALFHVIFRARFIVSLRPSFL